MKAYYNEIDPYCAQWLRNLIDAGHIAPGDVDERDIRDVRPDDLKEYGQCHFFAGIGGWSYAARLAGIPDDEPIWTGSCPCQPFSTAGRAKGMGDERHLWPSFFRLISECRPAKVFGEQVSGKLGYQWLAGIRLDLENARYAVGAADLPAASVGAPHIRQRLWWVADAERRATKRHGHEMAGAPESLQGEMGQQRLRPDAGDGGTDGGVGDTARPGLEGAGSQPRTGSEGRVGQLGSSSGNGFWDTAAEIPCGDGKARRIEPGIQPLAHGISARVGKLRAAGNAIVPQVAAEFMRAYYATQT